MTNDHPYANTPNSTLATMLAMSNRTLRRELLATTNEIEKLVRRIKRVEAEVRQLEFVFEELVANSTLKVD